MFRSISWQLQFSYGLLVLVALIGVGVFGYQHRKSEMLRQVDEVLQNRSKQIGAMLVRHDLGELGMGPNADPDAIPSPIPGAQATVTAGGGGSSTVPALPRLPGSPPEEPGDEERIRYRVWEAEAGELRPIFQSAEPPEVRHDVPLPRDLPASGILRTDGAQRELLNRAVRRYVVLCSLDLADHHADLNRFLVRMVAGELAFLLLFVAGGYGLTRKALRPIDRISQTAKTIAGGALDQRIPEEGGSAELEALARVLNDSFDRLEQSLVRERRFTSDASHELRTPITAILAEAQSKPQGVEELRESLGRCGDTARSMGQLVDQLLTLARLDAREHELQREPTDLDLLVGRAVQMVAAAADARSIRIETQLDPVQAEVNGVGITQVVVNLLDNAIAHSADGGTVAVRLGETADAIEIAIADRGAGIAEEHLRKIFDRFYRADAARSDHGKEHFGLGLAISREIAVAHGGDLRVESEPGEGSVFSLVLPNGSD